MDIRIQDGTFRFDPMISAKEYNLLSPEDRKRWDDELFLSMITDLDTALQTRKEMLLEANYGHATESEDKYGDMHQHRSGGRIRSKGE